MDPVYAGTISGMVLLFGGFIIGLAIYIYGEWRNRNAVFTRV
jgi:hypothetical protein